MREFPALAEARKAGLPGFVNMRSSGISLAINVGDRRQEVAHERRPGAQGHRDGLRSQGRQRAGVRGHWLPRHAGLPVVLSGFDGVAGIPFDAAEAKKLLDTVKPERAGTVRCTS